MRCSRPLHPWKIDRELELRRELLAARRRHSDSSLTLGRLGDERGGHGWLAIDHQRLLPRSLKRRKLIEQWHITACRCERAGVGAGRVREICFQIIILPSLQVAVDRLPLL